MVFSLSGQFPKNTFGTISHDSAAESLADDDPYSNPVTPRHIGEKIEQRRGKPTSVLFDPFDVGAVSQEERTACR